MIARLAPKAAVLTLLAAVVALAAGGDEASQLPMHKLGPMARPEYNDVGALLRPEGYERWTLVGTSIGLDYSPAKGADEKLGIFHNVYTQPEAFDHYVEHGEFPEQTIFVVTNNPPTRKEGSDDIHRRGHFAGEPTGLEVSVKDSKRFDVGWGYFMYYGTKGPRTASAPFARQACYDCHAEHGEEDAVFVQFYSVLKGARARRLQAK